MVIITILITLVILVILLTLVLLPAMALFNKFSDRRYRADEKEMLTGILTTGLASPEAVGEVVTTFVNESRRALPAKIYLPNKAGVSSIPSGATVLIIETKAGIAYVIPYQESIF
ncbi:hypothetical protein [Lactococcus kimchii]|uniref:hypothetical protein n=1 Tax=Lactococcus sp. S-13 TaxID=2507158 RepID=UPI001023CB14|nr:hypothetical protein [Lactococcus sp. S-13]RZI48606.1 hypothetical protein EQJ87_03555 [Lactococcus sp. S-13]